MASNLTVKVHPVVYMTIVDSYMRRARPTKTGQQAPDKVLGTLLGFYEKGAIQVTNCFAIPFSESRDSVELDVSFNEEMITMLKKASPAEQPIGWFYTSSDLSSNCIIYHEYYYRVVSDSWARKEVPTLLLTLDTTFSAGNDEKYRMPVRAYVRSYAGIPGQPQPHCVFFNPLRVELDAFPGERVAMQLIQSALDSKRREVTMEGGMEQLLNSTTQITAWLKKILEYVNEVVAKQDFDADATMGRHLMDIVNTATTHLQTEKLDNLVKNANRDYTMIHYLATLVKTQLNVHEKMVCLG